MLRATSTCAYKAAKLAAPGSASLLRSFASQTGHHQTAIATSLLSQSSLPTGVTLADCTSKLFRGSFAAGSIGAYRCSTGLAQKDDPVPEGNLEDKHLNQAAARDPDKTYDKGHIAPHRGLQVQGSTDPKQQQEDTKYWLMQPVYSHEYTESVKPRHIPTETVRQKLANTVVQVARTFFDRFTSYNLENMNERKWLRRFIFLETVAGVPGMVGGMLRHMRSLRSMRRDNGWIHTLLEEAENERMHLLTFLQLRQPGLILRAMVLLSQGVFFNAYFLAYVLSPKSCHAFVGYLEEEAVKTYTHAIDDLDKGRLPEWSKKKVPEIARDYWKLGEDATMRDLLLSVRADEACHSHVNHTFSQMALDDKNPFITGTHVVPTA